MKTLYIVSTSAYAGKSLAAIAIALHLKARGLKVGYFKPLGSLPVRINGETSDEDAVYIAEQIGAGAAPADLCPIILDEDLIAQACAGKLQPPEDKIRAAFQRVSEGKEVMIAGGIGRLARGALVGLCASTVARLLEAQALIVARYEGDYSVEEALIAQDLLKERMLGIIFNCASPSAYENLKEVMTPCLEKKGIKVFGVLPEDSTLRAISIGELAEGLGAKVLCGEKGLEALAEHFLVGAMGPQSAAKYLQQVQAKVVVTGGDRPDIHLAALQTSTRGLILTGGLHPSPVILKRARELGVPVLLVSGDTFSVVEEVERLHGRLRVRGEAKVKRAKELFAEHVDMERLCATLGFKEEKKDGV
jgi:BioD-like phosphotransacetylase family protein